MCHPLEFTRSLSLSGMTGYLFGRIGAMRGRVVLQSSRSTMRCQLSSGHIGSARFEGALAAMISSAHPSKVAEVIVIHRHFISYHPQVNKMRLSIKDAHAFTIGEAGISATAFIGRNLTTDDLPVARVYSGLEEVCNLPPGSHPQRNPSHDSKTSKIS